MWIKNKLLCLVVGIPLASVVFGVAMLFLALSFNDQDVQEVQKPLSKMSWRANDEGEVR